MPPRPMPANPCVASPLARKLSQLVTLAPDEIGVLESLQSTTRLVRRNREVITEGRKYDALRILIEGVSIRCRVLHGLRRPARLPPAGRPAELLAILPHDRGCRFEANADPAALAD